MQPRTELCMRRRRPPGFHWLIAAWSMARGALITGDVPFHMVPILEQDVSRKIRGIPLLTSVKVTTTTRTR